MGSSSRRVSVAKMSGAPDARADCSRGAASVIREMPRHRFAPVAPLLVHVSPPFPGRNGRSLDVLYVSTSTASGKIETMAFEARPDGTVVSWDEVAGGYGYHSPKALLATMGYCLVQSPSGDAGTLATTENVVTMSSKKHTAALAIAAGVGALAGGITMHVAHRRGWM